MFKIHFTKEVLEAWRHTTAYFARDYLPLKSHAPLRYMILSILLYKVQKVNAILLFSCVFCVKYRVFGVKFAKKRAFEAAFGARLVFEVMSQAISRAAREAFGGGDEAMVADADADAVPLLGAARVGDVREVGAVEKGHVGNACGDGLDLHRIAHAAGGIENEGDLVGGDVT